MSATEAEETVRVELALDNPKRRPKFCLKPSNGLFIDRLKVNKMLSLGFQDDNFLLHYRSNQSLESVKDRACSCQDCQKIFWIDRNPARIPSYRCLHVASLTGEVLGGNIIQVALETASGDGTV